LGYKAIKQPLEIAGPDAKHIDVIEHGLEFAGALYHVTARGNDRKIIYIQEDDF
jgi:hypothetical protein